MWKISIGWILDKVTVKKIQVQVRRSKLIDESADRSSTLSDSRLARLSRSTIRKSKETTHATNKISTVVLEASMKLFNQWN